MYDRPLLMSTPMMFAVNLGRKVETRRPLRYHPAFGDPMKFLHRDTKKLFRDIGHLCPYGQQGTRLWLRETWAVEKRWDKIKPSELLRQGFDPNTPPGVWYKATIRGVIDDGSNSTKGRWRPSIHMPKVFSRVTLKVKSVGIERVQNISPEAVLREGVRVPCNEDGNPIVRITGRCRPVDYLANKKEPSVDDLLVAEFASLWETIHGKGSWEADSLVWVIGFEVCRGEAAQEKEEGR
jgi:hypothetical protein